MDEEVAKYREVVDLSISIPKFMLILGEKLPFAARIKPREQPLESQAKREYHGSSKWRHGE